MKKVCFSLQLFVSFQSWKYICFHWQVFGAICTSIVRNDGSDVWPVCVSVFQFSFLSVFCFFFIFFRQKSIEQSERECVCVWERHVKGEWKRSLKSIFIQTFPFCVGSEKGFRKKEKKTMEELINILNTHFKGNGPNLKKIKF